MKVEGVALGTLIAQYAGFDGSPIMDAPLQTAT